MDIVFDVLFTLSTQKKQESSVLGWEVWVHDKSVTKTSLELKIVNQEDVWDWWRQKATNVHASIEPKLEDFLLKFLLNRLFLHFVYQLHKQKGQESSILGMRIWSTYKTEV